MTGVQTCALPIFRKGDDLLCYRPQPEAGTGADVQNSPARVEDLFDSFAAGAERPPVLRLDFDGDGAFMQGDIEVVRPAVRLPRDGQPAEGQSVGEVVFVPADAGGVGGADLPLPSGSGHAGPLHPLGFAPATGSDPDSPQAVVDHSTANAEVLGQCVDGTALPKQTRHLVRVDGLGHRAAHVGPAAELDVRLSQPPPNGFPFDPEFPAELLGRFAGKVAADQIVNIVRFHYDGPVYDVETEVGYFTAADGTQESILTRNCRCAWSPIHRRELERRLKAGETIHEG